jgi:hypothetical protein
MLGLVVKAIVMGKVVLIRKHGTQEWTEHCPSVLKHSTVTGLKRLIEGVSKEDLAIRL